MRHAERRPLWGLLAAMALGWCLLNPNSPTQDAFQDHSHPANDSAGSPAAQATRDEYALLFGGDVMLSRGVGARMEARADWDLPFREIAPTLRDADLRFCNLECPLSDRGDNQQHLYSFRADPRALAGLQTAGFEVVSQANNHSYDWGPAALKDSLERLRAAGIRPVGAGENALAAHYPVLVHLGDLRLAFLAYVNVDPKGAAAGVDRAGVAWLEPTQALADIRFAKTLADLVIVCPHWGTEYALQPDREQVLLAHRMVAEGADLIVGSHPHVVQPLECYRGRWIAYSLGNFVFDQKNPATHQGLLLKVTVRRKAIAEVMPIAIRINPSFQPAPDSRAGRSPMPILEERGVRTVGAR